MQHQAAGARGTHAPFRFLVVGEEAIVQGAELCDRRQLDQQPAAGNEVDRSRRVAELTAVAFPQCEHARAAAPPVDGASGGPDDVAAVGEAHHRPDDRRPRLGLGRFDQQAQRIGRDIGVIVEQPGIRRIGAARLGQAEIVAAGEAEVVRVGDQRRFRVVPTHGLGRAVLRAVVDHEHAPRHIV